MSICMKDGLLRLSFQQQNGNEIFRLSFTARIVFPPIGALDELADEIDKMHHEGGNSDRFVYILGKAVLANEPVG